MAGFSSEEILDLLYKKVGFGANKSGTSEQFSPAEETSTSFIAVKPDSVWKEATATNVPTSPPSTTSSYVQVYTGHTGAQPATTSAVVTCSANADAQPMPGQTAFKRSWDTELTNWIGPTFGAGYLVKVYVGPANWDGDTTDGTITQVIFGSNPNRDWYFDYEAGMLYWTPEGENGSGVFEDSDTWSTFTDTHVVYIAGYRYIGATGVGGDGISLGDDFDAFASLTSNVLEFDDQTANKVLAGPTTGGAGAVSFRALVATDIPTLNQNTTGTADLVTVTDNNDSTAFPVVFHNNSNGLLDDTGGFTYNPNTSVVTATTFTGALAGNVAGNVTGNLTGNVTGNVTGQVSDISNHDTGDLTEGSNLYYTDTRSRLALSATDAGGDGSFSYDNSTGVLTYTGPSAAEVRAHFSEGTGVTITSGEVAIGQAVGTTDAVTFAGVTAPLTGNVTGNVAGNVTGNVTGDLTGDVTGNVSGTSGGLTGNPNISVGTLSAGNTFINGNLTVDGDVIQKNTSVMRVEDSLIELGVPLDNADSDSVLLSANYLADALIGFEVILQTDNEATVGITNKAALVYDHLSASTATKDKWKFGYDSAGSVVYDNVTSLKFDVTTTSLAVEAAASNDLADLYGTNSDAVSNDTQARSIGAISKCTIEITTESTDGANNFAPVAAASNGYPIEHGLGTQSIYVTAIQTHDNTGSALTNPVPIVCRYRPLEDNVALVKVGITQENEKYDIIVIG